MLKKKITVINKLGLHARAAAKFVSCASRFSSKIKTSKDGELVDAKSIMSVMMLAASKGTEITLQIDGSDEKEALFALTELIENRFEEAE
tara:strand:+ start:559 stop:828 length:270 start_codon:yes stop_codon:yes gene_type:complete